MRETDSQPESGEYPGNVLSIGWSYAKSRAAAGSELDEEVLLDRVESVETHDRPLEARVVVLVQQGLTRLVSLDQSLPELPLRHDPVVSLQFLTDDGMP